MKFNFFSLKKNPLIEDVDMKVPTPATRPVPMTFDEALAAQAAAAPAVEQVEQVAAGPAVEQVEQEESAPETVPVVDAAAPVGVDPVVDAIEEAAPVAPVADAEPVAEPEIEDQSGIVKVTSEDVVAAYKIFLRRKPENQMVVESRLGVSREKLFVNFITAKEFIKYPENIALILQTAREMEIKDSAKVQEVLK